MQGAKTHPIGSAVLGFSCYPNLYLGDSNIPPPPSNASCLDCLVVSSPASWGGGGGERKQLVPTPLLRRHPMQSVSNFQYILQVVTSSCDHLLWQSSLWQRFLAKHSRVETL